MIDSEGDNNNRSDEMCTLSKIVNPQRTPNYCHLKQRISEFVCVFVPPSLSINMQNYLLCRKEGVRLPNQ